MARKRKNKKDRPPLLSFLLRDFKGRSISAGKKKEEKEEKGIQEKTSSQFSAITDENFTSRLLSALLREPKKRQVITTEKNKDETDEKLDVKAGVIMNNDDDNDDEDDELLPQETSEDLIKGRFEVLPSNPLSEDYLKRAEEAVRSYGQPKIKGLEEIASKVRMNADNYRHMYLEQRDQEQAMTTEKEKEIEEKKKKELEAARKAAEEQRVANSYRYRARELQNQIAWWKQQFGAGQYDEVTINTTIDNLQRELNGIPQGYW